VKGVIRDRDEAALIQLEKKAKEMEETRRKMEAANLGGKTYPEEEWEKGGSVGYEGSEKMQQKAGFFGTRKGRFGHLREVGLKSFLPAVEEDKEVVVLHMSFVSLKSNSFSLLKVVRCYLIDEKLARLAREFPDVKFLRARAAVLGFASLNKNKAKSRIAPRQDDDEDDPYIDTEN